MQHFFGNHGKTSSLWDTGIPENLEGTQNTRISEDFQTEGKVEIITPNGELQSFRTPEPKSKRNTWDMLTAIAEKRSVPRNRVLLITEPSPRHHKMSDGILEAIWTYDYNEELNTLLKQHVGTNWRSEVGTLVQKGFSQENHTHLWEQISNRMYLIVQETSPGRYVLNEKPVQSDIRDFDGIPPLEKPITFSYQAVFQQCQEIFRGYELNAHLFKQYNAAGGFTRPDEDTQKTQCPFVLFRISIKHIRGCEYAVYTPETQELIIITDESHRIRGYMAKLLVFHDALRKYEKRGLALPTKSNIGIGTLDLEETLEDGIREPNIPYNNRRR